MSQEDPTVIQRVLSSSALALESTMIRLRRLKNPEPELQKGAVPETFADRGAKAPVREQGWRDGKPISDEADLDDGRAGRIEHDSRGSAVWNWAVDAGAMALENTQRLLKRLETPALTLDEKPADKRPKPAPVTRDAGGGYDPYDRGKPAKRR